MKYHLWLHSDKHKHHCMDQSEANLYTMIYTDDKIIVYHVMESHI